ERRACWIMLWYLNCYQPVRSLPRVFAKVTGVAVESRPGFSVGDVADCFVEISAHDERPNFAVQDGCQNRAELSRKIESCDQSKDVTQQYEKKDNDNFLPHNFGFLILSDALVKHKVTCNTLIRAPFSPGIRTRLCRRLPTSDTRRMGGRVLK